ncbi:hypothetical protein EZV62_015253 [Acer yangbiense]|uniref:DUF4057 domain-containing protein n=1 Tax=Acer yangbiense TaxID=1000413 RepID=A0A5C7HUU0_9ROSI|nr:hypothetical protein EZV62_015253 [Acer yangbiense]
MERTTPIRKPNASNSDLLAWPEGPYSAASSAPTSAPRSHQVYIYIYISFSSLSFFLLPVSNCPCDVFRRPCSGYKLKEINGSGIFAGNGEDGGSESGSANPNNRTTVRVYQQAMNGISQISFSAEETVSPKKPTSIPEVAKQRELSGTLQSDSDMKSKKQISNAKYKEISGHDIFSPAPEIQPRSLAAARSLESKESKDIGEPAPRNLRTSVKVSNPAGGQSNILFSEDPMVKTSKKIHNQKFQELTGNDIFKGDVPPGSAEKPLSTAKLREISGNDIFADGKAESRDYFGGVRKPPGGESSIALV